MWQRPVTCLPYTLCMCTWPFFSMRKQVAAQLWEPIGVILCWAWKNLLWALRRRNRIEWNPFSSHRNKNMLGLFILLWWWQCVPFSISLVFGCLYIIHACTCECAHVSMYKCGYTHATEHIDREQPWMSAFTVHFVKTIFIFLITTTYTRQEGIFLSLIPISP